jgi:hypothetical protein
MNTTELAVVVDNALGAQVDFTPYQAAGAVSKIVGERVREQMMYNYVAKGYIASRLGTRTTNKGEREVKVIPRDALREWVLKYAAKKLHVETTTTEV